MFSVRNFRLGAHVGQSPSSLMNCPAQLGDGRASLENKLSTWKFASRKPRSTRPVPRTVISSYAARLAEEIVVGGEMNYRGDGHRGVRGAGPSCHPDVVMANAEQPAGRLVLAVETDNIAPSGTAA
jgi:hypothetical protein